MHHQRKRTQIHTSKKQERAHSTTNSRPSTNVEVFQALLAAHNMKAMASGASQGTAAPWVRPHRRHHLLGAPCAGGAINAPRVSSRWFPILSPPNRPPTSISRGVELSHITHLHLCSTLHLYLVVVVIKKRGREERNRMEEEPGLSDPPRLCTSMKMTQS